MALVIYSGGLDSTVLLYKLFSEGKADGALSVNYGQRHVKEIECARQNCARLGVPFEVADISSLRPLFGASSLTDYSVGVPDGNYADENMKSTVVPNRNMIMLSIAAARAIAIGADSVAYAAHSGDHAIYPDCRPEFAEAVESALKICHYTPITLMRPFRHVEIRDSPYGGGPGGRFFPYMVMLQRRRKTLRNLRYLHRAPRGF